MSRKRQNTSSPELESPVAKRRSVSIEDDSHGSNYSNINQRPQVDATTGQSGAFPGLGDDDELFYGPAADGIDYLRMVRSERKDIPELLTTIQPPAQDETDGGYWYDGAYTAQPIASSEQEGVLGKAQSLYYDSLRAQFRLIRATMNCLPPLSKIKALEPSRPISFPPGQRAARDSWEKQILHQPPHPVQVACMDTSSVLEVIKYITKRMGNFLRTKQKEAIQRMGAWIWALLGKCPERGELGSEEISDLRLFAQKANEVVNWMEMKGIADQAALIDDGDDENDREVEGDQTTTMPETRSADVSGGELVQTDIGQHYKSAMQSAEANSPENGILDIAAERRMLADMILTVVGELYGQRDLLDLRRPWQIEAID